MNLFWGVIEDRNDPLKLGRVRVRVIGIHPPSRIEVTTDELPWAVVLQPTTSAAISGIGSTPFLLEGTHVAVAFRDEFFQEPVIVGSVPGIPQELTPKQPGQSQSYVTDSQGNPITDSSGQPVITDSNDTSKTNGWYLGKTSEKYESNGKPEAINDYEGKASGDRGGASYGMFQLASFFPQQMKDGSWRQSDPVRRSKDSPVQEFVKTYYPNEFAGKLPATKDFDDTWRQVVSSDIVTAKKYQHDFIGSKYYQPAIIACKRKGFDFTMNGPAVQDMVWSTAVQYGANGCAAIIEQAFGEVKDISDLSDAEIVKVVQNHKFKTVDKTFANSSNSVRNGVKNRCKAEMEDLVALAGDYRRNPNSPQSTQPPKKDQTTSQILNQEAPESESGNRVVSEAIQFGDPRGKYPRWVNESDLSRLARSERIEQTAIGRKEKMLVRKTGAKSLIAPEIDWIEPNSPYKAQYPYNHVMESECGHLFELDDTPGHERVHIFHKSGSFVEFHPDGKIVLKSMDNQYNISFKDNNAFVQGNLNIVVQGNSNIFSNGSINVQTDSNIHVESAGNMQFNAMGKFSINAQGGVDILSKGAMLFNSEGDLSCKSNGRATLLGKAATDLFSGGLMRIQASTVRAQQGFDIGSVDPIPDIQFDPIEAANYEIPDDPVNDKDQTVEEEHPEPVAPPVEIPPETTEDIKKVEVKANDEVDSLDDFTPGLILSPNFTLGSVSVNTALTKQAVLDQCDLSKKEIVKNLQDVCVNVLEPVLANIENKFIITSAFRKFSGTNASGKVSQHVLGMAVDLQFPALKPEDYASMALRIKTILEMNNGYDQLIIEYHGKNPVIHISWSNKGSHRLSYANQCLSTWDLKQYNVGLFDINKNKVA